MQLGTLQESAHHFWDIQQIRKDDPDKEKKVIDIIQNLELNSLIPKETLNLTLKKRITKSSQGFFQITLTK